VDPNSNRQTIVKAFQLTFVTPEGASDRNDIWCFLPRDLPGKAKYFISKSAANRLEWAIALLRDSNIVKSYSLLFVLFMVQRFLN